MKVHDIASVVRAGEVGFHSENEFNRYYTQKHTIVRWVQANKNCTEMLEEVYHKSFIRSIFPSLLVDC